MKPVETAQHTAAQAFNQRFEATIREVWGVWIRLMQEEFLKATFSRREDAEAFANKHATGGHRGEIRKMRVVINEALGEVYALDGAASKPLLSVDLDFSQRTRMHSLRNDVLARLSDDELQALGLRRN